MQKIIDCHTHVFPENIAAKAVAQIGNHYGITMHGTGLMEDLIKSADQNSINQVVIHATATRPHQVVSVNQWIAQQTSERVIGFGTLHPDFQNIEAEFERIIESGLKGIKLHPDFQGFYADDPKMDRIYKAIGNKLPILMHAGDENQDHSSPVRIARVLERFPDLTVIAAHLGGHRKWQEATENLIGKNLYIDTSSALWFMEPDEALTLIRSHGTKRVLFGTDYPIVYHHMELELFHKLGLTQEEKADILYNNAASLLGISN